MKILITGFAPFGGEAVNPSWEAVSRLPEQFQTSQGEAAVLSKHQMPVSYNRCGQIIEDFIRRELPDCVVCVGQAGGRAGIEVEQIAINLKDAQSPDNEGTVFSGEPVTQGGPDGRFARLPVRDMVKACREAGVPGRVSFSAGAYVCNCLMYHVLELIEKRYPDMRGGFIHVPYECGQAALHDKIKPSLPLATIADGLLACLKAL